MTSPQAHGSAPPVEPVRVAMIGYAFMGDGAPQALGYVRSLLWEAPSASFDAAFATSTD